MRKYFLMILTLFITLLIVCREVPAQFTISIPEIPRIRKKPKPPQTDTSNQTTTNNTSQSTQTTDSKATDGTSTVNSNTPNQDKTPTLLSFYIGDINKGKQMIDDFAPGCCIYFVDAVRGEWLLKAVSPKAFGAWLPKDKEFADWDKAHPNNEFDTALAALADAAAKKLPTYKPDPKKSAFHSLPEEKMMKSQLNNLATLKIFQMGLTHGSWQIDKNSLGIPTDRYKWGIIWARDTGDDHPYCHIYHVNVIQDYSGGGTYGATYAKFISDELAGCQQ